MAKGKGLIGRKSVRDRAIDNAVRIASQTAGAKPGGAILVSQNGHRAKPAHSHSPKSDRKSRKTASVAPTALAMALETAGLAPPEAEAPVTPDTGKPAKRVKPAQRAAKTIPKASAAQPPARNSAAPESKRKTKAKRTKEAPKAREKPARVKKPSKPRRSDAFRPVPDTVARAQRMQERHKEAAQIIAGIGHEPPDRLLALWLEQVPRAQDHRSAFQALARDYVDAIEGEWRRRTILARLDPDFFNWPSTKASPGTGQFGSIDYAEGILGYLGYGVGKTGDPSSARRQALLSRVFEGDLPPINGPEYMDEWSQPGTAQRLRKMADSIASAVKSAKRRSHADYSAAIEHWEEDLAYLHRTYYVGRFAFDWPGSGRDRQA